MYWSLFSCSPIIFGADKVAAPASVIFSLPTLTIISEAVLSKLYLPPEMLSVEFARNPLIKSLPSPAVYAIKALSLLKERFIVSPPMPPAIVASAAQLAIESLPAPPMSETPLP